MSSVSTVASTTKKQEIEQGQGQESFLKKNIVPISLGTAVTTGVAAHLLPKKKLLAMMGLEKKHGGGFSALKVGGMTALATTLLSPFTCWSCGSGMLLGAGALLSSYLPSLWKGTPSKCGHSHPHTH